MSQDGVNIIFAYIIFYFCLVIRMVCFCCLLLILTYFFFQAEDGIRDLVRSRGLGDVYKRQLLRSAEVAAWRRRSISSFIEESFSINVSVVAI